MEGEDLAVVAGVRWNHSERRRRGDAAASRPCQDFSDATVLGYKGKSGECLS